MPWPYTLQAIEALQLAPIIHGDTLQSYPKTARLRQRSATTTGAQQPREFLFGSSVSLTALDIIAKHL